MARFRSALNKNKDQLPNTNKPDKEPSAKSRWTQIIDAVSKLVAASAVLAATFVANEYQSSMTTVNLLAKREEAESSLRAGMFRDLIKPITGSEKNVIPVEREQLMTELLALNFHEHFELKPLMMRVDERLANEDYNGADGKLISPDNRMLARKSLRSVARRVVQRQVALLTKEDGTLDAEDRSCIYELELVEKTKGGSTDDNHQCLRNLQRKFGEFFTIESPDRVYTMSLQISRIEKARRATDLKMVKENSVQQEWDDGKFKVDITVNHVCFNTVESNSPMVKFNAESEIRLISALRYAKDPEFIDDDVYNKAVNKALEFMWYSESNFFGIDYLRQESVERWERIQKYQQKLKNLDIADFPMPEMKDLKSPEQLATLPPNINCKTSKMNKNYLNSNYSLKVDSDFTLTNFDFPFTDNTLLADGTRFSIVLDKVKEDVKSARFKIIWFPKDYIAARERPVNFTDIRNKLGISFSD